MSRSHVILFGASGFVGSAVAQDMSLEHQVVPLTSPRLSTPARHEAAILDESARSDLLDELTLQMTGADVVINAAGNPDASSLDEDALFGANALLPAVLLRAATKAQVPRFVHVSSAVVQNDKAMLDSSEDLRPFSPYSSSKVVGEHVVRALSPPEMTVVRYRPPSVHAPGRRVTTMISRIASSPAATVARPGSQATPQALLPNVANAIAFLATSHEAPPAVVHHPSEGVTVTSLMTDLAGGKRPRRLPRWFAKGVVASAKLIGRVHRPTAANARRVELLWLGQLQDSSWLTSAGWTPPIGRGGWQNLATVRTP